MYRVCIERATGRLIEMQSSGDDRPDLMEMRLNTLKQNALNAGHLEADIEVKWLSEADWKILEAATMAPTPEQVAMRTADALIKTKMRDLAIAELKKEGKLDKDGKPV